MLAHTLKIHHKTRNPLNSKYSFSSLYLTIGAHIIGDRTAESVTELLCSEIETMLSALEGKQIEQKQQVPIKDKIDAKSFFLQAHRFFMGENKAQNLSFSNKHLLDFTAIAFPQNNECFDGEIGFLTCLDGVNAMLVWKDFKTKKVLSLLIKFDNYIEIWKKAWEALKITAHII